MQEWKTRSGERSLLYLYPSVAWLKIGKAKSLLKARMLGLYSFLSYDGILLY